MKSTTGRTATPLVKKEQHTIQALSPAAARAQLRDLAHLYEHTEITTESYDAAKLRIFAALESWGSL